MANEDTKSNVKKYMCIGLAESGSACKFAIQKDCKTCKHHTYMENYTDEMIVNLKLCKSCPRPKWKYFEADMCDDCMIRINELNIKRNNKLCTGLNYKGTRCTMAKVNDTPFCNNHKDLLEYTQEMLDNQSYCSANNHYRYCGSGYLTCIHCRKVGKGNREILKKERDKLTKCKKCNHPAKNGEYCAVHYTDYLKALVIESGRVPCRYANRNCKNTLPPCYAYKSCESCRKKYCKKDHDRRSKLKKVLDEFRENNGNTVAICLCCGETKDICFFYTALGDFSRNCVSCRIIKSERDGKNVSRNVITNEKRVEAYIKNASKERRNITWELTKEYALEIMSKSCAYCGDYTEEINDDGKTYSLMGIDRIDNTQGYIIGNVNPSCSMCNFMKYNHELNTFFKYCYNVYKNIGSKTPNNLSHRSYENYKRDAAKNGRKFSISEEEFEQILKYDCYYCDGSNNTFEIGIDRMNSNFGYCLKTNELVAACSICNIMKKNFSYNTFYNHILKILLHNKKISKAEYDKKYIISKFSELDELIDDIKKSAINNNEPTHDRRTGKKYTHSDKYYIDNIWNSYNISSLEPEIEFCETDEQKDTWSFYRNITSSYDRTNNGGLKILIRDAHSKKYLGLAELSYPSIQALSRTIFREHIDVDQNILSKKINNIMNISTCVPLQPFGYNFCGGKLIAKLMFSEEVYNYVYKKSNKDIYALFSFSLNGESIQYSDLNELSYIGKTVGNSNYVIKSGTIRKIKKQLELHGKKIYRNNLYNVSNFCKMFDIIDVTEFGQPKGIYFGYTGLFGQKFLQESNDTNNNGQYYHNLKNVSSIIEEWYFDHAMPRFTDLCKRDAMKHVSDIDYDEYFVSDEGYNRNRIKKSNREKKESKAHIYTKHSRYTITELIKLWFANRNMSFNNLAKKALENGINVDRRYFQALILGNCNDDVSKNDMEENKKRRRELETKYLQQMENSNNNDSEYNYITQNEISRLVKDDRQRLLDCDGESEQFVIRIKKSNLYFYDYANEETQKAQNKLTYKNTNIVIENVKKGEWKVSKEYMSEENTLFEMFYDNNDNENDNDDDKNNNDLTHIKYENTDIKVLYNDDHLIQYMALYQTKQNNLLVNDAAVLTSLFKITGKYNIFITNNKNTNCVKIITFCNDKKEIIGIKLVDDTTEKNITSHECCWCNNKGVYVKQKKLDSNNECNMSHNNIHDNILDDNDHINVKQKSKSKSNNTITEKNKNTKNTKCEALEKIVQDNIINEYNLIPVSEIEKMCKDFIDESPKTMKIKIKKETNNDKKNNCSKDVKKVVKIKKSD